MRAGQASLTGIPAMLVFIVVGVAFVGIRNDIRIDPAWERTTGTVVDIDVSFDTTDRETTFRPIVQYQVGEQTLTVKGGLGTNRRPPIGSSREVAYDPVSPREAKVVEGTTTQVLLGAGTGLGVLLVLGGIGALIRRGWQSRPTSGGVAAEERRQPAI